MQVLLEKIGRFTLHVFAQVGVLAMLFVETLRQLPKIRRSLTVAQMAHLGVNSLPIVSLTLLFAGMVMTLQIVDILLRYGAQSTLGGIMSVAMGRELGPILTGVVVAGRVGAAMTAEIGTMKVTEQIDALRCMATNPISYLVVPRFAACVIMVPILTFYGYLIGTGGGYAVAIVSAGLSHFTYINSIELFTKVSDIAFGMIKAMFFGGIISLVACYEGMHARSGAEGVGEATTRSVVTSIIFIFICNYLLSIILY
ncbi:MlaE family ABC transporter permease [Megasphaera vaginalis (ex Bordigoni et al. 2020)]|uniref:MlaE family ABC transporter permease n=1 Tax=Megasphaera vaginalis (ex Bordigoni et al. 2020) TaxID=2045301 RepID=UPI000C7ADA9D|nr:ABC transporter permease [Megasphaera vaginalis (ex Bordigoni et al. 2020)]